MTTPSITVHAHWFTSLLGAKSAKFYIIGKSLYVELQTGEQLKIITESISDKAVYQAGYIFSKLRLVTDKGEIRLKGLRQKEAARAYNWLRYHWILQLTPCVEEKSQQIKAEITKGYLRSSRIDQIKQLANEAVNEFGTIPGVSEQDSLKLTSFQVAHFWRLSYWVYF